MAARIRHVIFDFDGTCTQVDKVQAKFLDDYRRAIGADEKPWEAAKAKIVHRSTGFIMPTSLSSAGPLGSPSAIVRKSRPRFANALSLAERIMLFVEEDAPRRSARSEVNPVAVGLARIEQDIRALYAHRLQLDVGDFI